MILTRVFPGGEESIDLAEPDARDRLSAMYAMTSDPWLRLNLITSVNGSAAGPDGTSESLTNRADRALLGVIRRLADVVLVGAASVRVEGYRLPRNAPLAVVTASGDLVGHRLPTGTEPGRILVICPESAVEMVSTSLDGVPAEIIAITGETASGTAGEAGRVSAAVIIESLTSRGLTRIVCEGGPSLAAQLLDADLVDELCVSTSPLITSTRLALFRDIEITERRLELSQLLVDDASGLYARWLVRRMSTS